jgi:hypothetical protein
MVNSNKTTQTSTEMSLTVKTPINDIVEVLKAKKKSFENISDSKYITHGRIDPFPKVIKEETSIENLISMCASITGREKAFDAACLELGVSKCKAWNLEGVTADELKQDIKLRIAIIQNKEEMDELNKLIEESKEFMTIDDKKAAYLAKLENFVAKS